MPCNLTANAISDINEFNVSAIYAKAFPIFSRAASTSSFRFCMSIFVPLPLWN